MIHSTEELYRKKISGQSIEEISNQTGLNKWALYKRFQRLEKTQQANMQNEDLDNDESMQTEALKNTVPSTKEQNVNWTEITLALISLTTIFLGIFLYREYHHKDSQADRKDSNFYPELSN